jgi:hypothetical protein
MPEAMGVLYLALEDNRRRLRKRIAKLLAGSPAPVRLDLRCAWRRLDKGGLDDLDAHLAKNPDVKLVVVDVFGKVRQQSIKAESVYEGDYGALAGLKELADRYHVSIWVLHHTRKADAEDVFDTVSGSLGLTGAADALMVLQRQRGQDAAVLHVTGRDIEDRQIGLAWDKCYCLWQITDQLPRPKPSDTQQRILDFLRRIGMPQTVKQVSAATGIAEGTTKGSIHRLVAGDWLESVGGGRYAPAPEFSET